MTITENKEQNAFNAVNVNNPGGYLDVHVGEERSTLTRETLIEKSVHHTSVETLQCGCHTDRNPFGVCIPL